MKSSREFQIMEKMNTKVKMLKLPKGQKKIKNSRRFKASKVLKYIYIYIYIHEIEKYNKKKDYP